MAGHHGGERRLIAEPEFPGDDGSADPGVAAALTAYDAQPEVGHRPALAALQDARVLVPVVATVGEVEHDEQGLARDKTSDMAAVLITGRDGRTALLSFTSAESMRAWNPEARPVAVSARHAARAALQDGADALLVDVAGPVLFAVEGPDLRDIAEGLVLRRVGEEWGWTKVVEQRAPASDQTRPM
ncbi:MAG TPA: SseB family protein [Marmoricola sp.]|nr:SseB family protein [Marmoricola sp.]